MGEAVLPDQSDEGLDQGIAMTFQGLIRSAGEEPARNLFLVRFVPGVDPERAIAELADVTGAYTVPTQRPTDLVNFGRVDDLPAVAAALVACVAAAALAHALVTSTRRRRRDMALLKGLGFTGRQIAATVAWQATTIAVFSLAVGLPLGVALGRWLWILVADRLGVVAETVVSRPALLLLDPGHAARRDPRRPPTCPGSGPPAPSRRAPSRVTHMPLNPADTADKDPLVTVLSPPLTAAEAALPDTATPPGRGHTARIVGGSSRWLQPASVLTAVGLARLGRRWCWRLRGRRHAAARRVGRRGAHPRPSARPAAAGTDRPRRDRCRRAGARRRRRRRRRLDRSWS